MERYMAEEPQRRGRRPVPQFQTYIRQMARDFEPISPRLTGSDKPVTPAGLVDGAGLFSSPLIRAL